MTVFDVDENRETTRKVSLSDVAQFSTGSRHLTGDMKGTIQFDHLTDESFGKIIKAITCSQILTFPVTKRYSTSADLFITNFFDDIYSAQGFGKVWSFIYLLAATCQRHIPAIFICKKCMFVVSFMHKLVLLYVYFNILLHTHIYIYIYTQGINKKRLTDEGNMPKYFK